MMFWLSVLVMTMGVVAVFWETAKLHKIVYRVLDDYAELVGKYGDMFQAYRQDVMSNTLLSQKVTDAFINGNDVLARQYKSLCEIVMDKPLSDETRARIRAALDEPTVDMEFSTPSEG